MNPKKTPAPRLAIPAVALLLAGIAGIPSATADTHVNVITVTEATPEGRLVAPASPEHPIYYVAEDLGFREFGSPVPGDTRPPHGFITAVIVKTLQKQGYIAADKAHQPTQLIIFNWGTMYDPPSLGQLDGGDVLYVHGMQAGMTSGGKQMNGSDSSGMMDVDDHSLKHPPNPMFLRFMGGDKVDLMWDTSINNPAIQDTGGMADARILLVGLRSSIAQKIHDAAEGDLYVAALGGYDFKALLKGKSVKLWQTRIACPADGLALADTLPVMVVAAGPQIGRETEVPVFAAAAEENRGEVKIGEMKVLGTSEPGSNVIDATRVDRDPSESTP